MQTGEFKVIRTSNKAVKPAIHITRSGLIRFDFSVYTKKEGSYHLGFVPGYDLYFSAPTAQEAQKRGQAMVKAFCTFWIDKEGWKNFILQLYKLGFKPEKKDIEMKKLLNKPGHRAKFSSLDNIIPEAFNESNPDVKVMSSQTEMAV